MVSPLDKWQASCPSERAIAILEGRSDAVVIAESLFNALLAHYPQISSSLCGLPSLRGVGLQSFGAD